jgi:hypothetical protein
MVVVDAPVGFGVRFRERNGLREDCAGVIMVENNSLSMLRMDRGSFEVSTIARLRTAVLKGSVGTS